MEKSALQRAENMINEFGMLTKTDFIALGLANPSATICKLRKKGLTITAENGVYTLVGTSVTESATAIETPTHARTCTATEVVATEKLDLAVLNALLNPDYRSRTAGGIATDLKNGVTPEAVTASLKRLETVDVAEARNSGYWRTSDDAQDYFNDQLNALLLG